MKVLTTIFALLLSATVCATSIVAPSKAKDLPYGLTHKQYNLLTARIMREQRKEIRELFGSLPITDPVILDNLFDEDAEPDEVQASSQNANDETSADLIAFCSELKQINTWSQANDKNLTSALAAAYDPILSKPLLVDPQNKIYGGEMDLGTGTLAETHPLVWVALHRYYDCYL